MSDFVERVYDFNKDNGLLEKGYDDFLESSFQIEEALEGFPDLHLHVLGSRLVGDIFSSEKDQLPKKVSRIIAFIANVGGGAPSPYGVPTKITDVERLDKACDAVVYAIGSMAKLGLTTNQIHQAINIVMDANRAKTGCPKDEHGKLMKPANFPEPQPRLQELLDARTN